MYNVFLLIIVSLLGMLHRVHIFLSMKLYLLIRDLVSFNIQDGLNEELVNLFPFLHYNILQHYSNMHNASLWREASLRFVRDG